MIASSSPAAIPGLAAGQDFLLAALPSPAQSIPARQNAGPRQTPHSVSPQTALPQTAQARTKDAAFAQLIGLFTAHDESPAAHLINVGEIKVDFQVRTPASPDSTSATLVKTASPQQIARALLNSILKPSPAQQSVSTPPAVTPQATAAPQATAPQAATPIPQAMPPQFTEPQPQAPATLPIPTAFRRATNPTKSEPPQTQPPDPQSAIPAATIGLPIAPPQPTPIIAVDPRGLPNPSPTRSPAPLPTPTPAATGNSPTPVQPARASSSAFAPLAFSMHLRPLAQSSVDPQSISSVPQHQTAADPIGVRSAAPSRSSAILPAPAPRAAAPQKVSATPDSKPAPQPPAASSDARTRGDSANDSHSDPDRQPPTAPKAEQQSKPQTLAPEESIKPDLRIATLAPLTAPAAAVQATPNLPLPAASSPASPASPAAPLPENEPAPVIQTATSPKTPASEISMRIAPPGAAPVDVQLTDRAGQIHVAVRTEDQGLQTSLRRDLGTLVESLGRAGYETVSTSATLGGQSGGSGSRSNDQPADPNSGYGDPTDSRGGNSQQQQRQQHQRNQPNFSFIEDQENRS